MTPSTILLRRVGGMLSPADPHAADAIRKIPHRGIVAVRFLRQRSPEQLALYWTTLEKVIEATGRWRSAEELHLALKVATGRVDIVQLIDRRLVKVPGSISFEAMTQDEFQRYFDDAMRVISEELLDGLNPVEVGSL